MKILFLGNSHTFVHYVPARVAALLRAYGEDPHTVMLTHPGMGLDWHLEQSQTYYNLLYGGYDAVLLQHRAHPFPGRESLLTAGERLAALTPEHTRLYLYMTWSEKTDPAGQAAMTEAYEALAARTGATLCPVGRLWWPLAAAHPEADFYAADGQHTSVLGASLAGAVIGRTLLGLPLDPEACYADAQTLARLPLDPRMPDLRMQDGALHFGPETEA